GVRQHDGELLAAVARRQLAAALHAARQQPRDVLETDVAFLMAVRVVELLEQIDVDQDQAEWQTAAARTQPFGTQDEIEAAPVGDAGERIVERQLLEARVRGAELVGLLRDALLQRRCAVAQGARADSQNAREQQRE